MYVNRHYRWAALSVIFLWALSGGTVNATRVDNYEVSLHSEEKISGFILYKDEGMVSTGESVKADVTRSTYSANADGWIQNSDNSIYLHPVNSGEDLVRTGLFNATTFGLVLPGYKLIGWLNVDDDGIIHGLYDYISVYSVDVFVTNKGIPLKDSPHGSYICMYPIWEYTNKAPVITGEDVHLFAKSDWDITRVLESVEAIDEEDGDLKNQLIIKNEQEIKDLIEAFANESVTETRVLELMVEVTDSIGETTSLVLDIYVYNVKKSEKNYGYVRYISKEYVNTFATESIWNLEQRQNFLGRIL